MSNDEAWKGGIVHSSSAYSNHEGNPLISEASKVGVWKSRKKYKNTISME